MKLSIKTRFLCWLGVIALIIFFFIKTIYSGIHLNTNIMELLPESQQNHTINKAINKFSASIGKQIIFLIGNQQKELAQNAADQFFERIKQSPLLENISYYVNNDEQQAWGSFYFPYRLSLLTATQKNLLLQNKVQAIQQTAMLELYSPIGIANAALLSEDPFFLFQHYLMSLPKPANNIALHNQRLAVFADNTWYFILNATLKDDSFSISNQNKVIDLLQKNSISIINNYSNTKILMSGMLFYAKNGADSAERDITIISVISLIGIILLCLFTFKSPTPLIYTLISVLFGFIAAFTITQYIFGSVYLFTLILGASLIGIGVDYAFFYCANQLLGGNNWSSTQGLKNIFSGISLGLLNIIIAYTILSFTPFPALQQLAIFAITGLTISYITVVCLFPVILKPKPAKNPVILRYTNKYLNLCSTLTIKKTALVYSIIAIFAVSGICQLKANDDIHILESIPTYLTDNDNQIKKIIGSNLGLDFYAVTGNTPAQTLENEHLLTQEINQAAPAIKNKYLAITSYIPSAKEQQENFQLVTSKLINHVLINYLHQIGIKKNQAEQIQKKLAETNFHLLTIDDWLQSPVSKSMRFLWLGNIDNKFVSIVLLSNNLNPLTSEKIGSKFNFATYVNKAKEISQIFKIYRIKISVLLLIAYIALFLLLTIRYSIKKAVYYSLPPISACALSLGMLGWLGIPLTLFHILALILISGIGVDYVLFFAETKTKNINSKSEEYKSTMLATALSAAATILSFGLLIFSSTPAVHYFGITVLIGISSAFLLAPLVIL